MAVTVGFGRAGSAQPGPYRDSPIDLWRKVRNALTAENGSIYFEQIVGAQIPPNGLFDGRVVSQLSPAELIVNVDSPAGDAILNLADPLNGAAAPGKPIHFRGVIESSRHEPYLLTLAVEDEDEYGLDDSK